MKMKLLHSNLYRLLALLGAVLLLFLTFVGSYDSGVIAHAESSDLQAAYEQRNVIDDLTGSNINGKAFNLKDYPFNERSQAQLLRLVEFGYSYYANGQGDYGLYAYVYNPQGVQFDTTAANLGVNCIQIGNAAGTSYQNYALAYLNTSTKKGYEGLFYKFKVVMSNAQKTALLSELNSAERVYRVSGFELRTVGAYNATDYKAAQTFKYCGYSLGYGSALQVESSLECTAENLETLSLEVKSTFFRPKGTNGRTMYTQDSLHSVYFAVPNTVLAKYGELSKIHATWRDALLAPALVTGNEEAYNAILPFLGQDIGKHTDDLDYSYLGMRELEVESSLFGSVYRNSYSLGYNVPDSDASSVFRMKDDGRDISSLYMLFFSGKEVDSADEYTVTSELISSRMKQLSATLGGELVNGKYSRKLFESVEENFTEVNIASDETWKLEDVKIDRTWWEEMWGAQGTVTYSDEFKGIEAIHPVTDEDLSGTKEAVCERLCIYEGDYDAFKTFYEINRNGNTVFLFRYQMSEYIAQEATLYKKATSLVSGGVIDTNAFFFQETVNLDFDIIDVTFTSGEVKTVIPVVASPIDVIPDATSPVNTTSDKMSNWWKIVFALLFLLLLLVIFWPLLPYLVQFIIWLVTLPFKLLAALFKGFTKDKK